MTAVCAGLVRDGDDPRLPVDRIFSVLQRNGTLFKRFLIGQPIGIRRVFEGADIRIDGLASEEGKMNLYTADGKLCTEFILFVMLPAQIGIVARKCPGGVVGIKRAAVGHGAGGESQIVGIRRSGIKHFVRGEFDGFSPSCVEAEVAEHAVCIFAQGALGIDSGRDALYGTVG